VDAEVLSDQRPGTLTDAHRRFKLEDVLEEVPLHVMVRAFGYLRVDTIILPDKDESYVFEPKPDPCVEEMIAEQIGLIEERTAGLLAGGRQPMNRESLLRYAGTHTLGDAIDFEYFRGVRGIACVFLDEKAPGLPATRSLAAVHPSGTVGAGRGAVRGRDATRLHPRVHAGPVRPCR